MNFLSKLLILLLLLPSASFAREMRLLPDGELRLCGEERAYCYDFETAKALFLADLDCYELQLKDELFAELIVKQKEITDRLAALSAREAKLLVTMLETQEQLLLDYQNLARDYDNLASTSNLGKGMMITAGVAAAAFAGGILFAVWLTR